jgi:hypothetical protein
VFVSTSLKRQPFRHFSAPWLFGARNPSVGAQPNHFVIKLIGGKPLPNLPAIRQLSTVARTVQKGKAYEIAHATI